MRADGSRTEEVARARNKGQSSALPGWSEGMSTLSSDTIRGSRPSSGWIARVSRVSAPVLGARPIRRAVLLFTLTVLALFARPAERHLRAAALLLGLSGPSPAWVQALEADVAVEGFEVAIASGPVRARIYRPLGAQVQAPRGMVLAHGVHHLGIDEPRLIALARAFARAGMTVMTPELGPLADYHVDDEGNLETLRASVRALARDERIRRGGVGLMGVSFAGGLAQTVAADADVARDLVFVASIGGHNEMGRIAKFFVTDRVPTPTGEIDWRAHDYGLAVLVYNRPAGFVSAEDAPLLRAAVRAFLHESYAQAQQISLRMSPAGRAVFEHIDHRDRAAMKDAVLRELPSMESTMAMASPHGRLAAVRVPLFLLHGAHDDVVPPSESQFSALEAKGPVDLLVTSKIGHAELGKDEGPLESVRLVHFMARLLDH